MKKDMGIAGKKFDDEAILQIDYPVIIEDTYGVTENSTCLHCHDFIEVCYVKEGSGRYLIGGRDYPFEKGDIFVISNSDVHIAYSDVNLIMLVLLFKMDLLWNGVGYMFEMGYLTPFWEFGRKYDNKLDLKNRYYDEIVKTILEMQDVNTRKESGYRLVTKTLLLKLSTVLRRYMDIEHDTEMPEKFKNYELLQPLFNYINCSYYKKIKLEDMASLVNMSISNFSTVFKNTMGISPIEYLIRTRIVKASQMLLETDRKIIDVAEDCGFFSMSHFIESFKKYIGKSPKNFRKNAK